MDAEAHTCVVLCLGVPKGVEFGLDMTLWEGASCPPRFCLIAETRLKRRFDVCVAVGPKFKGVKGVPPVRSPKVSSRFAR